MKYLDNGVFLDCLCDSSQLDHQALDFGISAVVDSNVGHLSLVVINLFVAFDGLGDLDPFGSFF